jgi:hypothetical protein
MSGDGGGGGGNFATTSILLPCAHLSAPREKRREKDRSLTNHMFARVFVKGVG